MNTQTAGDAWNKALEEVNTNMKEEDIKKLSKKELQNIVLKMQNMMSGKQKKNFKR